MGMITEIKGFEDYMLPNPNNPKDLDDQRMYKFANNRGASVIFHYGSYGFEQGLLELMMVDWTTDGSSWSSGYEPWGYLTTDKCAEILKMIKEGKSYEEIN